MPGNAEKFLNRLIDYTGADMPPDLVVWPETSLPYLLDQAQPALDVIARTARGAPVVLGAQRREPAGYFNAMALLDDDGSVTAIYDKVHLVPYGEYLPFDALMTQLGLAGLAANIGGGFQEGDARDLIDIPGVGMALPLICYEGIFAAEVGDMPARPRLMLMITNDAWFGRFSGPYQHFAQARARTIEQGLPMVRVAQTGVSAMIDGKGRVTAQIPLNTAGYLDAALPDALPPTLYSRLGDGPALIAMMLALLAALTMARRFRD